MSHLTQNMSFQRRSS